MQLTNLLRKIAVLYLKLPHLLILLVLGSSVYLSVDYLLYGDPENLNKLIVVIIAIIALDGALARLTFAYVAIIKSKNPKLVDNVIKAGELFFHSTISLIFALLLFGAVRLLWIATQSYPFLSKLNLLFIGFAYLFFSYSIFGIHGALIIIENILFHKVKDEL